MSNFSHNKITISIKGKLERKKPNFGRLIFPTFEIASSPTIHILDVKQRRFNIIDRVKDEAVKQIQAAEDERIFEEIDNYICNKDDWPQIY